VVVAAVIMAMDLLLALQAAVVALLHTGEEAEDAAAKVQAENEHVLNVNVPLNSTELAAVRPLLQQAQAQPTLHPFVILTMTIQIAPAAAI